MTSSKTIRLEQPFLGVDCLNLQPKSFSGSSPDIFKLILSLPLPPIIGYGLDGWNPESEC
jgi:hypothetical protein